jgi:hypothetical protein
MHHQHAFLALRTGCVDENLVTVNLREPALAHPVLDVLGKHRHSSRSSGKCGSPRGSRQDESSAERRVPPLRGSESPGVRARTDERTGSPQHPHTSSFGRGSCGNLLTRLRGSRALLASSNRNRQLLGAGGDVVPFFSRASWEMGETSALFQSRKICLQDVLRK